jgi:hypothetical protein
MEFTLTQDFPAGLDRLWAAFGRAEYPRLKYLALGATAVRLHRFSATAQAIDVELERVMPVDPSRLPRWSRAFVGSEQTLRHHTVWRRIGPAQATAELDISPTGLPVRAQGTATIVESGPESTRMLLTWRVQSRVPVIGGRVERLFADQVRNALEADHAFTLQYRMAIASKHPRALSSPRDAARRGPRSRS